MKTILEKSFTISMIFGVLAVIFCLTTIILLKPVFILVALSAGFFGFILGCLHIVAVQRYGVKQAPTALLLLSLLLNSIPLIYMMMVVTKHT